LNKKEIEEINMKNLVLGMALLPGLLLFSPKSNSAEPVPFKLLTFFSDRIHTSEEECLAALPRLGLSRDQRIVVEWSNLANKEKFDVIRSGQLVFSFGICPADAATTQQCMAVAHSQAYVAPVDGPIEMFSVSALDLACKMAEFPELAGQLAIDLADQDSFSHNDIAASEFFSLDRLSQGSITGKLNGFSDFVIRVEDIPKLGKN
jgi:hypothetical protein